MAIFEACLRCNSSCGYCDLPLNEGRYEMTRAEIQRAFGELYREGIRFVFVQGGEPFLRRDIMEVLGDLQEIGFGLTVITNGTRFTERNVSQLAQLGVNISVSLDTLDPRRYQSIRGADQLEQVLHGIHLLNEYPHPKYLTCIVSEVNRLEVLDVVRFSKAKGFIPVVGAYHWNVDRYGRADPTLQYEKQVAAEVFREVLTSGLVPRGYFRHYLQENVRWLTGKPLERCDAGRYSIAIDASGNIAPCLALRHAGNILESSFREILNRFSSSSIQQCSDQSSCNMLCSRVVGSILRHPLNALQTPSKA